MHDTTDYRFVAGDRQLLVRQAPGTAADLPAMAQRYAAQLRDMLGATQVTVSEPQTRPDGTPFLRVTATLPSELNAPAGERVKRSAFLALPSGLVAQLSLQAPATDTGAEAEFLRLVQSITLSAAASPEDALLRTLAAGEAGSHGYPVGNLRIDLTPDYHGPAMLTVQSADHSVSHALERTSAATTRSAAAIQGPLLTTGPIGVAIAEDGRPVRYETASRPAGAASLAKGGETLRSPPEAAPTATRTTLRGVPVVIHTAVRREAINALKQAEDFLQALKADE